MRGIEHIRQHLYVILRLPITHRTLPTPGIRHFQLSKAVVAVQHLQHGTCIFFLQLLKYTSVIYIAKSVLELALAERDAGEKDVRWQEAGNRHFESAQRAVDELVRSQGNFETEGEMSGSLSGWQKPP